MSNRIRCLERHEYTHIGAFDCWMSSRYVAYVVWPQKVRTLRSCVEFLTIMLVSDELSFPLLGKT